MKKVWLFLMSVCLCGCAALLDAPKNIAGFSTRDIEETRGQSVYQSYTCGFSQCFSSVVDVVGEKGMNIFSKDEKKGLIVLMGVPGAVDTTEVGVFFSQLSQQEGVKIEISSRSSPAKRAAARIIFGELNKKFSKAQ